MGVEAKLTKEENILEIMKYKVLGLPALVIDEKVVSAVRRLSVEEVKELIKNN